MKDMNLAEREAVNADLSKCGSGVASARFVRFQHKPVLKVGLTYTVTDGVRTVSGRLVECDWQGNHKLDTKPTGK